MSAKAHNHLVTVVGECKPVYVMNRNSSRPKTSNPASRQNGAVKTRRHLTQLRAYPRTQATRGHTCARTKHVPSPPNSLASHSENEDELSKQLQSRLASPLPEPVDELEAHLDSKLAVGRHGDESSAAIVDNLATSFRQLPLQKGTSADVRASNNKNTLITEFPLETCQDDEYKSCTICTKPFKDRGCYDNRRDSLTRLSRDGGENGNQSRVGHGRNNCAPSADSSGESISDDDSRSSRLNNGTSGDRGVLKGADGGSCSEPGGTAECGRRDSSEMDEEAAAAGTPRSSRCQQRSPILKNSAKSGHTGRFSQRPLSASAAMVQDAQISPGTRGTSASSRTDNAATAVQAPHQQRSPRLTNRSKTPNAGRVPQRPVSARAAMEHYQRTRKDGMVEEMKVHLQGRIRARKAKSIVGDDIFQRQMKSGFWTSEVLYHQWGNDLLAMRNTWKENTSQELIRSISDDYQPPPRLRGRRQAISVTRDRRTPLTMETMSFVPGDAESNEPVRDGRRRSSYLHGVKERTFSVDHFNRSPIRLDVQEVSETRRQRLRTLFRDTIIKVCRIVKVMFQMISTSKASTYSGLMASLHFTATADPDDPTRFRKEHFSRKYAELHVPRWAKRIAVKDPWERTPEEIIRLYGVMRNMRSFERFTKRMRMEICRAARYNECGKGRVIVRQHHVGYNFYFIFSGSVFVQLDVLDESSGVMTTTNVNTLTRGSCFGELALLGGGKRTASVLCRETTELFEIEKETFLEVCPDIFDNELTEKIEVALEVPFFKTWPESNLRRLCFESPIQEVDFGKIVEQNPGSSDYGYVVLEGKVSLLKECDLVNALAEHCRDLEASDSMAVTPGAEVESKAVRNDADGALDAKMAEKLKTILLPEWTKNGKCYMTIGLMSTGHSTDLLPVRLRDREQLLGVTLVSRGCRLMKVTKHRMEKLAPREVLETFRLKHDTVLPKISNDQLFERYLVDSSWRHYRVFANVTSSNKRASTLKDGVRSREVTNYLVTAALLKDKRGRIAAKEHLKEILEKYRKRTKQEEEEGAEQEEESDQDHKRKVYLNKLKKGTLPTAFSKIEDTYVL